MNTTLSGASRARAARIAGEVGKDAGIALRDRD
jgi:hypothetical protein